MNSTASAAPGASMVTLIVIAVLLMVALVIVALWLKKTFQALLAERDPTATLPSILSQSVSQALHSPLLDLQDRIARSISDLRESSNERLSKSALESQERLERALTQNRGELQNGLAKTTEVLQSQFRTLEAQVSARLQAIGESVEMKLNDNLKEGFKHFEKVQEHLAAAELKLASLNIVGQSISDLNQLLKLPHLRGNFGETTLDRLLADFLPVGSYELQYTIIPGSTERVDAVVKLARQVLPIDSKFPREQVEAIFETNDPAELERGRKMLAEFVRGEAKSIASKYIRPDHGTTDLALMFLPSETVYFEVIRNGKLFEDLSKLKVYPVSPNTLAMGLHSITMAQEYYDMSRGVEKTIEDVRKARKHFESFEKKFEDVGKGLKKAQEAFETANTHLGRYESSVFRLVGEKGTEALESPAMAPPSANTPFSLTPPVE